MATKRYIADWHYGHANAIKFDNRPFSSLEEMNSVLVERWNKVVLPGDVTYVLGDMFWCKTTEAIGIINQLNGLKILIKGNHDRCNDTAFSKCFSKIDDYMEIDDEGTKLVLCHYPIPCFKNHHWGWTHLYGHVHNSFEYDAMKEVQNKLIDKMVKPCRMINVGCMMPYMDYTPRTLKEILEGSEGK